MKHILLILLPLFCISCTSKPLEYKKTTTYEDRIVEEELVWLGGSVMTDSELETAEYTKGDKTIKSSITKKRETRVPLAGMTAWGLNSLADIQAGVDNTAAKQATKTTSIKSKEAVSIKAIEADVTKATFVP